MICSGCKLDLSEKDFLPNQEMCFSCVYKKKKKSGNYKEKKRVICKICKNEIIHEKSSCNKKRTSYCSNKCAWEAKKIENNKHWTKLLRAYQC